MIGVEFAREARDLLEAGNLAVDYREGAFGHSIEPAHVAEAADWLGATLPGYSVQTPA